jgi:uncharacterized protein YodC (DUF2158 family)
VALAATTTECAAGASPPIYLGRWFDGWAKGRTSFHKKDVHPTLLKSEALSPPTTTPTSTHVCPDPVILQLTRSCLRPPTQMLG